RSIQARCSARARWGRVVAWSRAGTYPPATSSNSRSRGSAFSATGLSGRTADELGSWWINNTGFLAGTLGRGLLPALIFRNNRRVSKTGGHGDSSDRITGPGAGRARPQARAHHARRTRGGRHQRRRLRLGEPE